MTAEHPTAPDVTPRAVSFDLFGTLVEVRPPANPADAVAAALRERGIPVPTDWQTSYESPQVDAGPGVEYSLYDHVEAALPDGAEEAVRRSTVEAAVDEAFDPGVETVRGAARVVRRVGEQVPVAVLSNSSLPGLVARTVERSALAREDLDAIVTSVDCGWRKPHSRAFEAVAASLEVGVSGLVHVGDDPETDGGVVAAGGRFVSVQRTPLESVPTALDVVP
ncbi:MAG: HAD family hydrolase [Halanaeroarchaeum sp.]